jgi:hypothetical protein
MSGSLIPKESDAVNVYPHERHLLGSQRIGQFLTRKILLQTVQRNPGILHGQYRSSLLFEFIPKPDRFRNQHGYRTGRVRLLLKLPAEGFN